MITAGVVALGLAAWNTPSKAQGPMYDRVNVNLPYSVTIGDRTLQPGDYVIQQLRDQGGGSRVLLIYSDNGMKFETSAMTIPALDQNTPESTKVILHHFGNDYYFDKVWIQGKDYGYEFPVPDSVKARERERMQPISVAATYSTVQQTDTTTNTNTTTAATTQGTTTAANSAATNRHDHDYSGDESGHHDCRDEPGHHERRDEPGHHDGGATARAPLSGDDTRHALPRSHRRLPRHDDGAKPDHQPAEHRAGPEHHAGC